jgi:5'-deoxynucleotidase YfbR-like HD superfamily hydrolase
MAYALLGAFSRMFMLQRWNFLPRVESWVEAENIAYTTHLGYALAREADVFADDLVPHYLARSLLKSFTKHFLSDVSYRVRDALAEVTGDAGAWDALVRKQCGPTAKLFPREIAGRVRGYLLGADGDPCTPEGWERIECVIRYAQLRAAEDECKKNGKIYPEYYEPYLELFARAIEERRDQNALFRELDEAFLRMTEEPARERWDSRFPHYFAVIRCLKDLRRWNQVNRSVETSVLGHTFAVAALAWIHSWMHEQTIRREAGSHAAFVTRAVLMALFHDVSEGMTGDVITPVKDTIAREWDWQTWQQVERKLGEETLMRLLQRSPRLRGEIHELGLLKEEEDPPVYSVASMVRACDRLGLIIECVIEHQAGGLPGDMAAAYRRNLSELQSSEWHHIRELGAAISAAYPAGP